MTRRISVAIPNYNYGHYLGTTIESVLEQGDPDIEIVVSDNASTDDSVQVARAFDDPRIRVAVNPVNVGFSSNLDRAVAMTSGEHVILLSSDDVMRPGALHDYRTLLDASTDPDRVVLASRCDTIDSGGAFVSEFHWPQDLRRLMTPDHTVQLPSGAEALTVDRVGLLRWSLSTMRNPLPFATVCYPRTLWEAVGGYLGSRYMNPDKWFHWRLLASDIQLLIIDKALFGYRVHDGGQANAVRSTGALKHMLDQYAYSFEAPAEMLDQVGISRADLERAFVRHDGSARVLAMLARGDRSQASRCAKFAAATYPQWAHRDPWWWVARILSSVPGGSEIARIGIRWVEFRGGRR